MKTIMREFRTKNFIVRATIHHEDNPDLSWDDTGEVAEKLNSGEYTCFGTEVVVTFKGAEIGSDYLGESIYANPEDFFKEHIGLAAKSRADGRNYGAYFPDMVAGAIKEARTTLAHAPKMRVA